MKLALTALIALVAPTAAEGPFRELRFEAALAAAKREEKVVMVDFFTTWCGPCKKLDETTWKDEAVVGWLGDETVPLKIDAEKEVELATEYRVRAYPTILFVRPDRTELGRVVGYRAPEAFLSEAADAMAGKSPVDRAREALVGNENDPSLRFDLGQALATAGRHAEALEEYLWCFDVGMKNASSFSGVRLSFLLSRIVDLGREHPPALEALRERRDAAREAVLGGNLEPLFDVKSIDDYLGQPEGTLALYDELKGDPAHAETRRRLVALVPDVLVEARRYVDLLRDSRDVMEWYDTQLEHMERIDRMEHPDVDVSEIKGLLRSQLLLRAGHYYEALAGAGSRPDLDQPTAAEFEERILELESGSRSYARLIEHAIRAETFDRARALAERAEARFTEKLDLRRVERAARKIPAKEPLEE